MANSSDTGLFIVFVGFTAMCCWNPTKDVTIAIEAHTEAVQEQTEIIERAVTVLEHDSLVEDIRRQAAKFLEDEDSDVNPDETEALSFSQ